MTKKNRKRALQLLFATLAVVLYNLVLGNGSFEELTLEPGYYEVVKVSDGDTIVVAMNGQEERVRLIGVDTPEKNHPQLPVQCFAEAASAFTTRLLDGRPVKLEADPTNSNRDRYDRLLRYVYTEDDLLVNKEIIAKGYGFAYTAFPVTKVDEFLAAEQIAKTNNAGLWGGCDVETIDAKPQTKYPS